MGRRAELEELRGLHDRARLVTLVGPGGCGKTRLALELVRPVAARKAWIELATVDDDGGVATAFLAALGERDDPQSDPVDQIVDSIGNLTTVDPIDDVPFAAATFVLLVDNAEHVVEPVARVVDAVLARVSGLRVVVTSREPLGIAGEAVYRVPPMGHAALGESSDRPGGRDAVDLFVDRASLVRPELKLDASALGTVSEICRRLDGLPLGVELAAARLDLLSPERIRDGLQDRFRLLVSGNRAALPRHRTLEASVAWSYSLLAADERHLLDRLAVFRGSFDTAAVDAVASGAVDADRVDDLLGRLVSKSLLAAEPRAEGTRFRLLDTIAAYAARQLAERGEVGVALDQLADHVARCTAAWDQDLMGDEQVRLLEALAIDDGIVSVALDHLTANARDGNVDAADLLWSIVGRLTFFWLSAGRFREARSWFATAEAVSASDVRLELPARWGASHLATYAGDFEAAIGGATATCQLAKELGDNRFAGRSLDTLGSIESYLDPVAAIATLEQAIELAERAHDRWGLTDARQVLAFTHLIGHDHQRAIAELDAARPLAVALDHPLLLAWDEIGRATTAIARGRPADAAAAIASSRAQVARTHDPNLSALLVGLEATDALLRGTGAEWTAALLDSRRRGERTEAGLTLPVVVTNLLLVLVDQGDVDGARTIVDADVDLIAMFAPAFGARLQGIATAVALLAGDVDEAIRRADLTRQAIDALANPNARAVAAPALALADLERGDFGAAEAEAAAALERLTQLDLRPARLDAVEVLALAIAARGDRPTARWLSEVGRRERNRLGIVRTELQQLTAGRLAEALETEPAPVTAGGSVDVGDVDQALGADEGGWPTDATIEDVIAYVRRSRGPRRRPSIGWASLTPTELQVVEAVAAGCTNAQAAERLFVSPSTIKTHLAHIFRKLDVANRAALVAAQAAEGRSVSG